MNLAVSLLLSLVPISELRGGIPYGYFNGLSLFLLYPLCTLMNALVAPICWLFLDTVHKVLYRQSWYKHFFNKTIERARRKVEPLVKKYEFWGLMVFVAVPLPMTGAWTGAIAAYLLQVPRHKALLSITVGVLVAGLIVSLVLLTGSSLGSILIKRF